MSTVHAANIDSKLLWVAKESLLEIDPEAFRNCFDTAPFLIGHRLAGHPLFELSHLVELCRKLPAECIEFNSGSVPISLDPEKTPQTGLSAEETIRRIRECGSWLVLKNVERDPEFATLMQSCLKEVRAHSDLIRPGMMKMQAFVFVTSPGAATSYHVDPEHNFLLQIQGSKEVHLFNGRDRSVISEHDLERYYSGAHRNLVYRDDIESKATVFEIIPGQGLHFPVTYPHWVKNGDDVSVSFSITFFTPDLDRRQSVYRTNALLRRRGWSPAPYGTCQWLDSLKFTGYRLWRRTQKVFGGSK